MDFTKTKFCKLPYKARHKKASELLRDFFQSSSLSHLSLYKEMEVWLALTPLSSYTHEEVSHRLHFHLEQAEISYKEHSLLYVRHEDTPSDTPFLPIHIFLSSLRSAFNVGSILRTTEAFRLGSLYFCPKTPDPSNPKVQKASMNTYDKVCCTLQADIQTLPRPWIALETATPSTPLSSFLFPENNTPFTLILGNEEFGVPKEILLSCDAIVEIPLCGSKNSLNVASAFAIVAHHIRSSLR